MKLPVPGLKSHMAVLENRGRGWAELEIREPQMRPDSIAKMLQRKCAKTWRSSGSAAAAVLPVSTAKCMNSQAVPLLNASLLNQARKIEGHSAGVANGRFATTISSVLCHEY